MDSLDTLELFPGSRAKAKPAFASQEEYERYREEFARAVRPAIEEYARKHAASVEASRYHFVSSMAA